MKTKTFIEPISAEGVTEALVVAVATVTDDGVPLILGGCVVALVDGRLATDDLDNVYRLTPVTPEELP